MSAPSSTSDAYDEMLDQAGRLRPAWRASMDAILRLGDAALADRARRLDRAFAEEGLTSLLAGAHPTSWRCDPIPLPFDGAAFDALANAAVQRARLLDAILDDVHGDMTLVTEGLLPPALVFPNPNFLRLRRMRPDRSARPLLTTYAVDLLRDTDGAWRVVADRCSTMEGSAYALENRQAMRRVVPELFEHDGVRSLDGFFAHWRDALAGGDDLGGGDAQPGLALLTAGPLDPHWFDHVLVAAELRCALVQPGDLTLRGGRLHIRNVRGLVPVDVLLRRQDGNMLDPLDVTGETSGVAGVLAAAAAGRVRIVNDPGAGFASTPALAAFLPAISERLLGEKLALPTVSLLWLGDARACQAFLASPDDWTMRSALNTNAVPVEIRGLSAAGRQRLIATVTDDPGAFVVTPVLTPSQVPCVGPAGMERRRLLLRLFLVQKQGDWQVMPGGLARALDDAEPVGGPLPSRGRLKDVLVLRDEVAVDRRQVRMHHADTPPLALRRSKGDLPGRAADDFFWLGVHAERLEHVAILARAAAERFDRFVASGTLLPVQAILSECLSRQVTSWPAMRLGADALAFRHGVLALAGKGGAFDRLVERVWLLIERLRDRLTAVLYGTMSQSLGEIANYSASARQDTTGSDTIGSDTLAHLAGLVLAAIATLSGLRSENMVRGGGRLFLELGLRFERAKNLLAMSGSCIGRDEGGAGLALLLELTDSTITYRGRYFTVLQKASVLDLVLADDANPRSLAFQLAALHELLAELEAAAGVGEPGFADAIAELRSAPDRLIASIQAGEPAAGIGRTLDMLDDQLVAIRRRVSRRYVEQLEAPHWLGLGSGPGDMFQ